VIRILKKRFFIYYLPIFIYIAIIIALSSIPSSSLPDIEVFSFDKIVHFFEYGIFAVILFRAFIHSSSINPKMSFILVILSVAAMGVLDESYQRFTGRDSDLLDWLADVSGATTGALVCLLLNRKLKNHKNRKWWNFWLAKIVCDD